MLSTNINPIIINKTDISYFILTTGYGLITHTRQNYVESKDGLLFTVYGADSLTYM